MSEVPELNDFFEMRIELDSIIPDPLLGYVSWDSEIWQKQVSFDSGRRYQLNAPSGNGKTSLLGILCGLRHGYQGQWWLDRKAGRSLTLPQWCELRRHRMAVMFQDLRLLPDLTVEENILLKANLTAGDSQVPEPGLMLEKLGLVGYGDRRAGGLSWGESQRVALVRTLCQPFELVLLDEPFSHLDPANIEAACEVIDEACRVRGAGMILTSLGYEYPLPIDCRLSL